MHGCALLEIKTDQRVSRNALECLEPANLCGRGGEGTSSTSRFPRTLGIVYLSLEGLAVSLVSWQPNYQQSGSWVTFCSPGNGSGAWNTSYSRQQDLHTYMYVCTWHARRYTGKCV